jgi:hypothetical protein
MLNGFDAMSYKRSKVSSHRRKWAFKNFAFFFFKTEYRPDIFADLRKRLFHCFTGSQDGYTTQLLARKPGTLVGDPLQK